MSQKFTQATKLLVLTLFFALTASNIKAQFSITTAGVANNWDFNGLQSTGTTHSWTNNVTISGFYNARQNAPLVFASYTVGTGSSNSGQLYSFGAAATADRALGSVGSGTPGTIANTLRLVNNTGSTITSLIVTYTGEQWRDGGAATPNAQPLSFYYMISATPTSTFDVTTAGYTAFTGLNFSSPTFVNTGTGAALDGNLATNRTEITATINLNWLPGEEIYLKWVDINDTGNDHGLAIDDLSITAVAGTPAPEINIVSGASNYLNNSTYNYGTVNTSTTNTATFTIQNTGGGTLNITTATFTGGPEYSVTSDYPIPMTIAAGASATFTATFSPTVTGTFTGNISFTNDDADENPYVVNVTGVAVAPGAPEIDVVVSTLNFGSIEENTTSDLIYTVQNTGTSNLVLSTSTSAPYSLVGTPPTTITAGNTATYTVRFSPTAAGTYNVNLVITSNDADEATINIALSGVATVALPEVFTETFGNPAVTTAISAYTGWSNPTLVFTGTADVRTSSPSTGYSGATGQGNVFLTAPGTRFIEISNINTSTCSSLTLSFGILKAQTAPDGSELLLEVSTDGSVYTPLTFPLLPTGAGTTGWYYRTAIGTIPQATNLRIRFTNTSATTQFRIDDVKLQGVCAAAPEINVVINGTNYANNTTFNFGTVTVAGTYTATMALQNTGTSTLNITNGNTTNNTEYSIPDGTPPPFSITAGGVLTSTMVFAPTAPGTFTNVVTIFSNDANESTYTVTFTGVAIVTQPEINIVQGATTYITGSTYNFPNTIAGNSSSAVFTIENTGTANLNINNITSSGVEFAISPAFPSSFTIAAGSTYTFTVTFSSTMTNTYNGNINLSTNDANEATYVLNFNGTIVPAAAPEINVLVSTLNFGTIQENTTADLTYVVQNTGTANLVLSTSTTTPYSLVGTPPTTITAGSSATYTVRFSPTAVGTYNVNLAITSNDADEATVNIALSGIATAVVPGEFFQNFNGLGTSSTAALPIDWKYSPAGTVSPTWLATGNFTTVNQQASSGAPNTGGRYNWGDGTTDRALGIMTSGSYASPNSLMAKFTNNTGSLVDKVDIAYDLERYRINTALASVQFFFSTDGTSWTAVTAGDVTTASLPTGASAYSFSPPNLVVNVSTFSVTGLSIADNTDFYLRWNLNTTGGNSQGIGIDNVWVKAKVATPAPEINLLVDAISYANNSTFDFGTVVVGGTYTAQVVLQNTGTTDLNVSNGNTTNNTEFNVTGGTPPPFIISAGNALTVTMVFAPTVNGTYTNILTLNSDDADESTYTVTFTGIATAPQPEINIKQGATSYLTASTYSFSNTTILTSNTVVFTIENTGTDDLNISNSVTSGTGYTTTSTFPMPLLIAAGNTATFSVTFAPTSAGTFTGDVTFTTDDADETTYVVNFTGVGQNAPEPEINVVTTTLNFGTIEQNTSSDLTFTIQNTGTADLVLSTSTAAPYSIVGTAPTTITAGSTVTYTVRFSPTAIGTFTENITISSNDADEPTINITLSGIGAFALPAIFTETFGAPAGTIAISSYTGWSNPSLTFTGTGDIRNTTPSTYTGASGSGNAFLSNSGGPRTIEISTINTSSCTSMTLSFGVLKSTPAADGSELHVEVSSDGTNYTSLTFPALPAGTGWNYVTASGTIPQATNLRIRFTNTSTTTFFRIDDVKLKGDCGAVTGPEINVLKGAANFASNSTHDFGTVNTSTTNVVTFTIQNTGNASLTISSALSGGTEFSVTPTTFPLTILAGGTSTFTVTFSPTSAGTHTGFITFSTNDADESSYIVNYTGIAQSAVPSPEINIKQGATSIASGDTYAFGNVNTSTNSDVVFTIENNGNAVLNITSHVISGTQFSLVGVMPASVAASSTALFTVRFNSSSTGAYAGNITLNNNDANESAYVVNFTATITSIDELDAANILKMYPNPNNGNELYFNATVSVEVFNAIGSKVIEAKKTQKIDISTLESGIYFVKTDKQNTLRLVVNK